jgi:hypothetical protein
VREGTASANMMKIMARFNGSPHLQRNNCPFLFLAIFFVIRFVIRNNLQGISKKLNP